MTELTRPPEAELWNGSGVALVVLWVVCALGIALGLFSILLCALFVSGGAPQ